MSTTAQTHPPRPARFEPGAALRWVMAFALLAVSVLVVVTGIRTAHLGDVAPIRPVHVVAPIHRVSPPPRRTAPAPSRSRGVPTSSINPDD